MQNLNCYEAIFDEDGFGFSDRSRSQKVKQDPEAYQEEFDSIQKDIKE